MRHSRSHSDDSYRRHFNREISVSPSRRTGRHVSPGRGHYAGSTSCSTPHRHHRSSSSTHDSSYRSYESPYSREEHCHCCEDRGMSPPGHHYHSIRRRSPSPPPPHTHTHPHPPTYCHHSSYYGEYSLSTSRVKRFRERTPDRDNLTSPPAAKRRAEYSSAPSASSSTTQTIIHTTPVSSPSSSSSATAQC